MRSDKKNLLLIGPIPDPKGGVSIHITRLANIISDKFNVKLIDESSNRKDGIFNIRSLNIIKYLRLIIWADTVHIHSGVTLFRSLHITISKLFKCKVIVTIHSLSHQTPVKIKINSTILKLGDKVILVSNEIQDALKIHQPYIKEAFIPPNIKNEKELPPHISNWIKNKRNNNKIIIAANASKLAFHKNIDLYGFDLCIKSLAHLINNLKENVCLILIIASNDNSEDLLKEYKTEIKKHKLEDNILLTIENISFVRVVNESDIILRPTNTDGDALTIREAIFFNKTVIASDVVVRPAGTITFKNRSARDLSSTIYNNLSKNLKSPHNNNCDIDKYLDFYLNIYNFINR